MALNKRGFIRILEVMIAITFLTIAVLYVYVSKTPSQASIEDYMYNFQKEALSKISIDPVLRTYVLQEDEAALESSIFIPENLNYSIRVCDLSTSSKPCNLDPSVTSDLFNDGVLEIYSHETIIATNLSDYDPKKVKIFIWQQAV